MNSSYQSSVLISNFKSYFDLGNPDLNLETIRNVVNKYDIITKYLDQKPQMLEYYYMYNNTIEGLLTKNYFNFSPIFSKAEHFLELNIPQSNIELT